MLEYTENYGEDADGNRGQLMKFYELEESDEPLIIDEITDYIKATGEIPERDITIYLFDSEGNDIAFEIDVLDYMTYDEMNEIIQSEME